MKPSLCTILQENQAVKGILFKLLTKFCPYLKVNLSLNKLEDLIPLPKETIPSIIFINPYKTNFEVFSQVINKFSDTEFILLLERENCWNYPLNIFKPIGHLYKPIDEELLIITVQTVQKFLSLKNIQKESYTPNKIGIPSHDGLDFVDSQNIIRCESVMSCTKIVLKDREKDIISSYNIGEFKKLLPPPGFFCPHKSHLINLSYLDKYKREGIIFMKEDKKNIIPVSRNKRSQFLSLIKRL